MAPHANNFRVAGAPWHTLVIALAAACVQARPQYWASPVWRLVPELPPCTAHPERDYAELYAPHGTPVADSTIVFTLYGKDNFTGTAAICPGETQIMKVSFPERRLALLTASQGTFMPHAGSISRVLDPNCPQRVDLGDSYYLNTAFTVDYTAPCNASEAEGILFKITSAPGAQQWRQSNVTFAVDPTCASVTCGLRGGNPRPRPRPASLVPRTSPSPSSTGKPSAPTPGYGYGGYGYGHIYGYGGYGYGGYGYGGSYGGSYGSYGGYGSKQK